MTDRPATATPELHRLLASPPKQPSNLMRHGSWGPDEHHWEEAELRALAAAAFSGRPLLVTGEPGVGKSQLARAAAALLGWRFEYEVITPRFEPQDLLWRFDAVRRLSDASLGATHLKPERDYATPGALWRALDPVSAKLPEAEAAKPGCVLLIDEIDKADIDFPNSLLEVLGNRGFKTRFDGVDQPIPKLADDAHAPRPGLLIVITSNNERELPLAFIRRCAVLDLQVPDERKHPAAFDAWLLQRGAAQFGTMAAMVRRKAAGQVRIDRAASPMGQGARPGLAEYLDLLRALDAITAGLPAPQRSRRQLHWLGQLSRFMLRKQPGAAAASAGPVLTGLPEAGEAADDNGDPAGA